MNRTNMTAEPIDTDAAADISAVCVGVDVCVCVTLGVCVTGGNVVVGGGDTVTLGVGEIVGVAVTRRTVAAGVVVGGFVGAAVGGTVF